MSHSIIFSDLQWRLIRITYWAFSNYFLALQEGTEKSWGRDWNGEVCMVLWEKENVGRYGVSPSLILIWLFPAVPTPGWEPLVVKREMRIEDTKNIEMWRERLQKLSKGGGFNNEERYIKLEEVKTFAN